MLITFSWVVKYRDILNTAEQQNSYGRCRDAAVESASDNSMKKKNKQIRSFVNNKTHLTKGKIVYI